MYWGEGIHSFLPQRNTLTPQSSSGSKSSNPNPTWCLRHWFNPFLPGFCPSLSGHIPWPCSVNNCSRALWSCWAIWRDQQDMLRLCKLSSASSSPGQGWLFQILATDAVMLWTTTSVVVSGREGVTTGETSWKIHRAPVMILTHKRETMSQSIETERCWVWNTK